MIEGRKERRKKNVKSAAALIFLSLRVSFNTFFAVFVELVDGKNFFSFSQVLSLAEASSVWVEFKSAIAKHTNCYLNTNAESFLLVGPGLEGKKAASLSVFFLAKVKCDGSRRVLIVIANKRKEFERQMSHKKLIVLCRSFFE